MMNPYLLLGIGVAFVLSNLASYFTGKTDGRTHERAAWMERENTELAAANAKILELNSAARTKEAEHAAAVNLISTTYEGERNAARKETGRLIARARAGDVRLRDPAAGREKPCASGAVTPAPGPGERDGGKGADVPTTAAGVLSGEASAFLVALTGEADEVVIQLTACQAVVTDDRRTQ